MVETLSVSRRRQALACFISSTLVPPADCFSPPLLPIPKIHPISKRLTSETRALIYGWDDTCDAEEESNSNQRIQEFAAPDTCTTSGIAVAESLSYDPDRVGSLARLAVAFSPPERALSLDQIEKVDVLCVEQDRIDIQAIVCEDGGCVSLSVPIVFPHACGDDQFLEGCVTNHLEQLDRSLPEIMASADDMDIMGDVSFPSWWVDPPLSMDAECNSMKDILNDAEFASEIGALAQESLDNDPSTNHQVQTVKLAAVGPAGLLFRVKTTDGTTVLDVLYPFGESVETVDALRATVLGLVATA